AGGALRASSPAARAALGELLGERVRFDAPLGRLTSLLVGGPAEALATPESGRERQARGARRAEHALPLPALGGGFNTLVRDGGMDGVVVRTQRLRALDRVGDAVLRAEAGVSHSQLTNLCVELGLAGLEFGAGIPGTIGGWIAMNAGGPEREGGGRGLEVGGATA